MPFTSFAHDHASPLHQSMKELGVIIKQVAASISDVNSNKINSENLGKMIEHFKTSYDHAAEAVEDYPENEQTSAIAEIRDLLTQEIQLAQQLQNALNANDNILAKSILDQMNAIKKDGHGKYK
jgi:hypothetical protein